MKEYYTTTEVAIKHNIDVKTVQKRIKELSKSSLIEKDNSGRWLVHHLALPKFKVAKESEFKAITIDTECDYSYKDLSEVIYNIFARMSGEITLNFTIETKRKDAKPHIHCYLQTEHAKRFIEHLKHFVDCDYLMKDVFDLDGWKSYISKETPIITLTKNNN